MIGVIARVVVATLPLLFLGCQGCSGTDSVTSPRPVDEMAPQSPETSSADDGGRADGRSAAESALQPDVSPAMDGAAGGEGAVRSTGEGERGAAKSGAHEVEAALGKARELRRSAAADEAAGRPDDAYSAVLQAWRVLRRYEGEPAVGRQAAQLRGDLDRLGEVLRGRTDGKDSLLNEKTMLVQ